VFVDFVEFLFETEKSSQWHCKAIPQELLQQKDQWMYVVSHLTLNLLRSLKFDLTNSNLLQALSMIEELNIQFHNHNMNMLFWKITKVRKLKLTKIYNEQKNEKNYELWSKGIRCWVHWIVGIIRIPRIDGINMGRLLRLIPLLKLWSGCVVRSLCVCSCGDWRRLRRSLVLWSGGGGSRLLVSSNKQLNFDVCRCKKRRMKIEK
jgi:hypothetical protein